MGNANFQHELPAGYHAARKHKSVCYYSSLPMAWLTEIFMPPPIGEIMIELRHGCAFDENDLVSHIKASGRDYIVQGQQQQNFVDHTKPQSLDYWLRKYFPVKRDTKLADNYVLDALVRTERFEIVKKLECPDTKIKCKGIRVI